VYDLAIRLMRAPSFIRYIHTHSITVINFDEENFEIPYYIFFIAHRVTSSKIFPNIILLFCSQNLEFLSKYVEDVDNKLNVHRSVHCR
jgi:hypothetical protein